MLNLIQDELKPVSSHWTKKKLSLLLYMGFPCCHV
jgi:hypothetical protein